MTSNNPVFYIFGEYDGQFVELVTEKAYHVPELNLTTNDAYDMESLYEYDCIYNNKGSISLECKVNKMTLYKICGLYDFVIKHCPNRKVAHLIKYGKNERVRNKNFIRALTILNKMI